MDPFDIIGRRLGKTTPPPQIDRPPVTYLATAGTAYAQKALDAECERVSGAQEGERNHTLNRAAFSLGQLVAGGALTEDEVVHGLTLAAKQVGLDDREISVTLRSGLKGGSDSPRGVPETPDVDGWVAGLPAAAPAGSTATDVTWETPRPLSLPVPEFPTHVFGWLEDDIKALAEELQTPVDLVGMLTLASLAATVRGRARITIRGRWSEPLNLYVVVIAGAGETKSPALSTVSRPLRDLEAEARDRAAGDVAAMRQARRLQEGRLKRAEAAAVSASHDDRGAMEDTAKRERETLDGMPEAVAPQYLAGDVTAEGLVRLLAEQGGVMASLSAEGGLFDTLAGGRYSSGMANLDAVLQAHDGREPILVDRKVGDPIRVDDPCLTLGLAVQPHVISSAGQSEAAVGRGFLARFLFSYPESRVGRRVWSDTQRDGSGFEAAIRGVDRLLTGVSVDFVDARLRCELRLTTYSLSLLEGFRASIEPRRGASGDLAGIQAWANKLDGQVARIAGLLHLLYSTKASTKSTEPPLDVPKEAMESALALADYLIGHSVAAHQLLAGKPRTVSSEAMQIHHWLRDKGLAEVSVRDVHVALRGRACFQDVAHVQSAMTVLENYGWLRAVETPREHKPGRPPSPRYLVNPAVFEETP